MDDEPKAKRGFAEMTPEKRKEISSKGGKAVPAEKRKFFKDRAFASEAGAKGGKLTAPNQRYFSVDRVAAKEAGTLGGKSSGAKRTKDE